MEPTRSHGVDSASARRSDVIVQVATHESELRAIRSQVEQFLAGAGAESNVIDDFKIVVSELATNVMQHSPADLVTIAMRRLERGWQLDVFDADEVPELAGVSSPMVTSLTGRGLLVVKNLMDEVSVVVDANERMLIRCTKFDD